MEYGSKRGTTRTIAGQGRTVVVFRVAGTDCVVVGTIYPELVPQSQHHEGSTADAQLVGSLHQRCDVVSRRIITDYSAIYMCTKYTSIRV